ncbi:MBL fold metallo-hydrolase [Limobrevibacterium gyesilva]|uniref:MBL fold metallo-hydrolase n=1 Tax=Limobrevibacterium gyesilva TaxID=2991712 RepID=A0AA41YHW6_9PROT|nr:MBL fold metallo-hydrolase [Limobrevibacterium gyesilva]MCW3473139.1 MBL fold metallo-hydrolase [Limobrevibacterium gyesilva]
MQSTNSGIHHIRIGDITVTALHDGMLEASTDLVVGVAPNDCEALLRESFRAVPPRITISSFLLTIGNEPVLVDTGCGGAMGPDYGHARRRLEALGVEPSAVRTILITHAHIDHVSGLLDADGAAYFPNAEVVLHEAEPAFWLDEAIAAGARDAARNAFAVAQRSLAPYRDRMRTVKDGGTALPGITANHLPGHTPGHSGWLVTSGPDSLLIWGDVVHLPGIQFARPEAGVSFDVDVGQGRASRARALDMAATDRMLVAGMHLDFPTFGHVVRAGGGYGFVPHVWAPAAA